MTRDADYYRARAMEERGRAEAADRVYLARLHRELAEQLIVWDSPTPATDAFFQRSAASFVNA